MRTTLTIDDDVFGLARSLADARRISLGEAVSILARRGANMRAASEVRNGFHVFLVEPQTPRFGPEEIRAAEEGADRSEGGTFSSPHR